VVGIEVLRPARDWPLEQIKFSFSLEKSTTAILDSLWGAAHVQRPYPFTKPLHLVG